jgi:hypothetical protein
MLNRRANKAAGPLPIAAGATLFSPKLVFPLCTTCPLRLCVETLFFAVFNPFRTYGANGHYAPPNPITAKPTFASPYAIADFIFSTTLRRCHIVGAIDAAL